MNATREELVMMIKPYSTPEEKIAELTLALEGAQREIDMWKELRKTDMEYAEKEFKGYRDRLGRDLNFEYVQYLNVADAPMTAELGEIMRDYLKSAFKTLKKSGVTFSHDVKLGRERKE